jgi:hypothetical protein
MLTACAFSGGKAGMPLAAAFVPFDFAPGLESVGFESAGFDSAGLSAAFAFEDFGASGVAAGAEAFEMSGVGELAAEASCARAQVAAASTKAASRAILLWVLIISSWN